MDGGCWSDELKSNIDSKSVRNGADLVSFTKFWIDQPFRGCLQSVGAKFFFTQPLHAGPKCDKTRVRGLFCSPCTRTVFALQVLLGLIARLSSSQASFYSSLHNCSQLSRQFQLTILLCDFVQFISLGKLIKRLCLATPGDDWRCVYA